MKDVQKTNLENQNIQLKQAVDTNKLELFKLQESFSQKKYENDLLVKQVFKILVNEINTIYLAE